jgi:hypothetical protein
MIGHFRKAIAAKRQQFSSETADFVNYERGIPTYNCFVISRSSLLRCTGVLCAVLLSGSLASQTAAFMGTWVETDVLFRGNDTIG